MKKLLNLLFVFALILSGCGKDKEIQEETTEEQTEEQTTVFSNENYELFIDNQLEVTIPELENSMIKGTYTLNKLKTELTDMQASAFCTYYTIMDLNHDQTNELVIRFINEDMNLSNFSYVIEDKDGKLEAVDFYVDGYRTYSNILDDGKLIIGGSGGAGILSETCYEFDENLKRQILEQKFEYHGASLTSFAYELGSEIDIDDYKGIVNSSHMYSKILYTDGKYQMCVTELSDQMYAKSKEDELIGRIKALGVTVISEEEMNQIPSVLNGNTYLATWTFIEPSNNEMTISKDINLLPSNYEEFKLQEEGTNIILYANRDIYDFDIVQLEETEVDMAGMPHYKATSVYHKDSLTASTPLLIVAKLSPEVPIIAISYLDEQNQKVYYSFRLNTYDNNILFEKEANIK